MYTPNMDRPVPSPVKFCGMEGSTAKDIAGRIHNALGGRHPEETTGVARERWEWIKKKKVRGRGNRWPSCGMDHLLIWWGEKLIRDVWSTSSEENFLRCYAPWSVILLL